MIETYHYAGFSVQTAIAKEQRDRDAADESHSFAKDTEVLRSTKRKCVAFRGISARRSFRFAIDLDLLDLATIFDQGLCLLEISGFEAFGEPANS
jgi:hypothetical protein